MKHSQDGYRPAIGLLRLTWPQVELVCEKLALLFSLTKQSEEKARLEILVKNGNVRFITTTLPWGELPTNLAWQIQGLWPTLRDIDSKISSLCGYTEQTRGQVRLLVWVAAGEITSFEMALSEELVPDRV